MWWAESLGRVHSGSYIYSSSVGRGGFLVVGFEVLELEVLSLSLRWSVKLKSFISIWIIDASVHLMGIRVCLDSWKCRRLYCPSLAERSFNSTPITFLKGWVIAERTANPVPHPKSTNTVSSNEKSGSAESFCHNFRIEVEAIAKWAGFPETFPSKPVTLCAGIAFTMFPSGDICFHTSEPVSFKSPTSSIPNWQRYLSWQKWTYTHLGIALR